MLEFNQHMEKITGVVIEGEKKGRKLGFPTANIALKEKKKSGVYSGRVIVENEEYQAAIFIGRGGMVLEAHLFDFFGNLYGQKIAVEIGMKIREIKAFDSDTELIDQIRKDLEIIKKEK